MAEFNAPALPPALAGDPRFAALCDLLWEQHARLPLGQVLLYLIDLAPEAALLPLAEQFSLTDESLWPDPATPQTQRQLIKQSIDWHRRKGTPWAVTAALSVLGHPARIIEWFNQTPPGPPYTFDVELAPVLAAGGFAIDDAWFTRARTLVHSAKPARSHLVSVRLVLDADTPAPVHVGACALAALTVDIFPPQPGALDASTALTAAFATMTYTTIAITAAGSP